VVPLLNRPFLAYQLALLRRHGVTDVILACSYRVDDVRQALGDGRTLGTRLRYVVEDVPLGTGGGVRNAADLARGVVLVLNGDVLTDADLTAMRRFHEVRGARVTIFLRAVDDPRPYGLVECAPDGRVRAFREKPTSLEGLTTTTINAGIYLIDATLLARIPRDRVVSIEREFFPAVVGDGTPCFGWLAEAYWRDIGTPDAYRQAQIDLLDGRVKSALAPAGDAKDGRWLGDGVRLESGARVDGPSVIGPEVEVGEGARVGPRAVVGARCRIGAGARVDGAVLWEDVSVGAGSVLHGCVVATGARIGAQATIGPGVTLEAGAVVPDGARLAC
jgi:NDP-sugar pyrophosphorylase family protein